MENPSLKGRILIEVENLIARSCPNRKLSQKFKNLHIALLKKHYNAADVSIDYHRKRVALDIVMDDRDYDPKKVNLYVPTLHANLLFKNLSEFLKSCIDKDAGSLAFYAGLLRSYDNQDVKLHIA